MKIAISLLLSFIMNCSFGQSPTFQALVALDHDVNNNSYELRANRRSMSELFWTNIYFNYYKNLNIRGSQKPDESMIFSVGYEYLIQTNIEGNSELVFSFPKGSEKDDFQTYTVSVLTNDSKESKIQRKYIEKNDSDSTLELIINRKGLSETGLLRVYCKIESFNLKTLRAAMTIEDGTESYLSFNSPAIFNYYIPDLNLTQLDKQTKSFKLKYFTYQSPPIVDYTVASNSFKWKLQDNSSEVIVIKSISIDLPAGLGTSLEQMMKYSN